ncbi:MAG: hypothetical protein ACOC41_06715 [Chitinivibrionales bacterium]
MTRQSEKRGRSPLNPGRLFYVIVCAGLVLVFLQNNFQIFSYKKEEKKQARSDSIATKDVLSDEYKRATSMEENPAEKAETRETHIDDTSQKSMHPVTSLSSPMAPGSSDTLFSLILAPVRCRVSDRPDMPLSVTLKLFFSGDEVRKEILLHRNGLAVIVKKVFSQTSFEDIVVDRMKPALLSEMNNLITYGSIKDLTFEDLHPIH